MPVTEATETTVRQALTRTFAPDVRRQALSMVAAVGPTVPPEYRWRVRDAAIRLSDGDVSKLGHYCGAAITDYRDVLYWDTNR